MCPPVIPANVGIHDFLAAFRTSLTQVTYPITYETQGLKPET